MKNFLKNLFTSALGSMFGVVMGFFLMLIAIPIFFAVLAGGSHAKLESIKDKSILYIHLHGELVEHRQTLDFDIFDPGSFLRDDRGIGLYELNKALDQAKNDKRIAGVFIEFGPLQAGWAGITSLRRHIADFTQSGKWVIAYAERLDEMQYYLGTAANQLYMQPSGELEFNGLAMQEAFLKGLFEKLDLQPEIFRVGKFKAAVEPLIRDQMSPENRQQAQALIDDLWKEVRETTARETQLSPAKVDSLASRLEVTSAESAKAAKLITDTKFYDEVEKDLKVATLGESEDLELVTPGRLLREASARKGQKKIAVLFAEGEIHEGESGAGAIGSDDFQEDLEEAKADEDVAAIVVRVNSPGGDALASDVIWRALRTTDEEMPVVVSMGDVAASGGYYMASAGRHVFAEPTTITGSIGVFGVLFNTEKFFRNKAGIKFDKVLTHPHADLGSSARAVTSEEAKVIQGGVERVYKRFLDVVQESRGYEDRSDLEAIAEGRVWSGVRAKELGLVDDLGGLEQAIAKAAEFAELKDYSIEIFPTQSDSWRHLFDRFSEDASGSVLAAMVGRIFGFDRFIHRNQISDEMVRTVGESVRPLKNGVFARMLFDLNIR